MRFRVARASNHGNDKPCEEAVYHDYVQTEVFYSASSFEEAVEMDKCWLDEGSNHRMIQPLDSEKVPARDKEGWDWFVEFATLDELTAFCEKYGSVVIEPPVIGLGEWYLEIYDNYRE
jgi:hypothetical protein